MLECTKFNFGWDSAAGAYSAPQDPQLDLRRPLLREKRGRDG